MTTTEFSADLLACSKRHTASPPPHLGTRFGRSGGFLPEAGNTVVCHVRPGSATQQALIAARDRYLAMPEAGQFLFTPITSLHMTVFEGVTASRRMADAWPAGMPLDAPVETVTPVLAERLRGTPVGDPFRVSVVSARPTGLLVDGATETDRLAMRAWRDRLSDLFGYRRLQHDAYRFHITFCYPIDWLDDAALPGWQSMLDAVTHDIRSAAAVLELRPPAFCVFDDMNHFHEILPLPAAA